MQNIEKDVHQDQPHFDILEADAQDGCITLCLSKKFARTVSWALRNCPEDNWYKHQAGVLSSQLYKVIKWLDGQMSLENLVDLNGRELVEVVIDEEGNERELRDTSFCP